MIVDVRKPIGPGIVDAGQAGDQAHDAAHVADVAVGVPAGHVGHVQGPGKVVAAVGEGHDDHRRVRDNVTATAVFVIAVAFLDAPEAIAPVAVALAPPDHVTHDLGVQRVGRDQREADLEQAPRLFFHERRRLDASHEHAAIDTVAVVRDRGRLACVAGRLFGVAGTDQPPGVDKDLPPDLLGNDGAVLLNRAGTRRRDAVRQVQVGSMLGADAIAAPPQRAVPVAQVVQPGVADLLRRELLGGGEIAQRADKDQRPREVVVGTEIVIMLDIAGQLAVGLPDPVRRPALDRRPILDADHLAQECGIYLFVIVWW